MGWVKIDDGNQAAAARLLRQIDSVQPFMLRKGVHHQSFGGWVLRRYFLSDAVSGAMLAYLSNHTLHLAISFAPDLPEVATEEVQRLLRVALATPAKDTRIWCNADNTKLVGCIAHLLATKPQSAQREMTAFRTDFVPWPKPTLPGHLRAERYKSQHHNEYISLLEEAMSALSPAGMHPYAARSDSYATAWSQASTKFLALWDKQELVGFTTSSGLEINWLAVGAPYRGQGLGYFLLYSIIQRIYKEIGSDPCLYVADRNDGAYRFYRRVGLQETGHAFKFVVDADTVG